MTSPASKPKSKCHGKVPAQGCNLTRDTTPRQEPRRDKRHGASRALWHTVAQRCASTLVPALRAAELGRMRQGLAVHVLAGVAAQLASMVSVCAEPPPWWAATAGPAPRPGAGGQACVDDAGR